MKNNIKTYYLSKKTSSSIWLNFLITKKDINKKIFSYAQKSNINLNYFFETNAFATFFKIKFKRGDEKYKYYMEKNFSFALFTSSYFKKYYQN